METELQRSLPPELQQSLPSEVMLSVSEHRATRGKDISSSYSSLIPKKRDKITSISINEASLDLSTNRNSETVLSFCIIINN